MGDRHQFRAKWHDYNVGIYFVTICTYEKRHLLGCILDNQFFPSKIGDMVKNCILQIPKIHPFAEVWNYVIMPNHIHMILSLVGAQYIAPADMDIPTTKANPVGAQYIAPAPNTKNEGCLRGPKHGNQVTDTHFNSSLAIVVRTFKAAVTRMVRAQFEVEGSERAQFGVKGAERAQFGVKGAERAQFDVEGSERAQFDVKGAARAQFGVKGAERAQFGVKGAERAQFDVEGSERAQCIAPLPPRVWQRNYHEHIIRTQRAYENIMHYIDTNVENWKKDCFVN